MPRNTSHAETRFLRADYFNEAEASLPRNTWEEKPGASKRRYQTSMRPRQACLGILLRDSYPLFPISHFNEAEASLPRNTVYQRQHKTLHSQPSMRPRQACLGIHEIPEHKRHVALIPSMRPRQACLGIQSLIKSTTYAWCTPSMRPRQACLGIRWSIRRLTEGLWRPFNEAEASLPRNTEQVQEDIRQASEPAMRPRQACLGIR